MENPNESIKIPTNKLHHQDGKMWDKYTDVDRIYVQWTSSNETRKPALLSVASKGTQDLE